MRWYVVEYENRLFSVTTEHTNGSFGLMNIAMTLLNGNRFITFELSIPVAKPSLNIGFLFCVLIVAKPMVLSTFTNSNSVEWFANRSLKIFGGHQWFEDCFLVPFNTFFVVVFVHQNSFIITFGGGETFLNKFAFLEVLPCRFRNWSIDQLHDILFLALFNYLVIGTLPVYIKAPSKNGINLVTKGWQWFIWFYLFFTSKVIHPFLFTCIFLCTYYDCSKADNC